MKLIDNKFNEAAYEYFTKEGLKVIIVNKKGFERSLVAYGTNFGALDLEQMVNGQLMHHKQGVAHFLEHKLFEDEQGDILSQFANMGANANAFTSYENTVYYFSTNMDIKEPMDLLVRFVNKLTIDEASVEKEKGIISEELKMYENNPDFSLLYATYRNVYNTFPLKYDIGGTFESVNATTLEDLENAYYTNYQPQNMCLVVVSGQDPELIKSWIDTYDLPNRNTPVETIFTKEPTDVVKNQSTLEFPVVLPKMSLAYKFSYDGTRIPYDSFMGRIILEMNFSEFDDNFQSWIDDEIINEDFSYHIDLREGFGVIYFFNEGDNFEDFEKTIDDKMKNLVIDETNFNQLKKRHYGQIVLSLAQYDGYAINLMASYFKGYSYYDYLESIRTLSYENLSEFVGTLSDFSKSFTKMVPPVV